MTTVIEISDSDSDSGRRFSTDKSTKSTVPSNPKPSNSFNYAFANFSDEISHETAANPRNADLSKSRGSLATTFDDDLEVITLPDDLDTSFRSKLNSTSANRTFSTNASSSKNSKANKEVITLDDSDDPLTSPPPAQQQMLSSRTDMPHRASGFKRSISNIEPTRASGPMAFGGRSPKRSKTIGSIPTSDPIFTSSPDRAVISSKAKQRQVYDLDDEYDFAEPQKDSYKSRTTSMRATADPADRQPSLDSEDSDFPSIENIGSLPSSEKAPKKRSRQHSYGDTGETAAEKKAREKIDKAQKAEQKKVAKEAEREEARLKKEYDKAAKAKEKEELKALTKVNIDRTDWKVSLSEMTVELPNCFETALKAKIHFALDQAPVKHSGRHSSARIVKWQRLVSSKFNPEMDIWEPVRPELKEEKNILIHVPAEEFVKMALAEEEAEGIDLHILKVRSQYEGYSIVYLIEGLTAWRRKNKNLADQKYKAAVRSRISQAEASASQRKKTAQNGAYISADEPIEDALLNLQVVHELLVHHTAKADDTAKWIANFTKHISTIPYKAQQDASAAAFCMLTGQVKAGQDPADTFVKMLSEIHRVTENIAQRIAEEYPTAQSLLQALKALGPEALEGMRKTRNLDGGLTDNAIGPAISKRISKVFLGTDPTSLDVT